jgi:hypothetical protein
VLRIDRDGSNSRLPGAARSSPRCGPPAAVVAGAGAQDPFEMSNPAYQDPVQAFVPYRSHPPRGEGVGARRSDRRADHPDTLGPKDLLERGVHDVAVADQERTGEGSVYGTETSIRRLTKHFRRVGLVPHPGPGTNHNCVILSGEARRWPAPREPGSFGTRVKGESIPISERDKRVSFKAASGTQPEDELGTLRDLGGGFRDTAPLRRLLTDYADCPAALHDAVMTPPAIRT